MELTPLMQRFVLNWGEMGARWGVNRTIAQIHALLYLAPRPINAEEIAGALGVARSHVSNSLRELQGWRLARTVHVLGDRRDHFECVKDVWEMFHTILDERKRREVDPTLRMLRECVQDVAGSAGGDPEVAERLRRLLDFFETASGWYELVRTMPLEELVRMAPPEWNKEESKEDKKG